MLTLNLVQHRRVTSIWVKGLFVDQCENVERFHRHHVEDVLVVGKVDLVPFDPFPVVLFLLQFEHMADKELLQLLIGVVDAELLKRVMFKLFKTKNIEKADRLAIGGIVSLSADAVFAL